MWNRSETVESEREPKIIPSRAYEKISRIAAAWIASVQETNAITTIPRASLPPQWPRDASITPRIGFAFFPVITSPKLGTARMYESVMKNVRQPADQQGQSHRARDLPAWVDDFLGHVAASLEAVEDPDAEEPSCQEGADVRARAGARGVEDRAEPVMALVREEDDPEHDRPQHLAPRGRRWLCGRGSGLP